MLEIIACFPVYRTYVREGEVSERDRGYIERAVGEAKRRNPNRPMAVYDFVRDLLLQQAGYITSGAEREESLRFIGKFQQITSPVVAKGIEDTALYIYNRLVSLNEVGGEPDHFGKPPDAVHAWLDERARRWPHGLSTSSTHDTKRSEDVRARLNALSEIPGAWKQAVSRWARINRRARSVVDGESYPSRNEEYLLYQTLLGSWPLEPMSAVEEQDYAARIVAYMRKAMREAKVYSNWLSPSPEHEKAMARFVTMTLAPEHTAFREDFLEFERKVARFGIYNSLAQLVLKIAAPGVPDFYQGTELWDFSLVDPDNRRPVDYERRRRLLAETQADRERDRRGLLGALMANPADDRTKLFTAATLLEFRRARRGLFEGGGYRAVRATGPRREHVFAFSRSDRTGGLVVAVPRLVATLAPDGDPPLGERIWSDTRIVLDGRADSYRHVLADRAIAVQRDGRSAYVSAADVFAEFPVAVLEAVQPGT
jgi:(1->4)-alpha-D-glucan 1-alpha-D-glucosylmutase